MNSNDQPKILIVEDDTFIRELYEDLFKDRGFVVKPVKDGIEAQEILEKESFRVTLLDIMLPELDGMTLLREADETVRENFGSVILLTNLGQDAVIKEGFEHGAKGYLIKSALTPDEVLKEVQSFL